MESRGIGTGLSLWLMPGGERRGRLTETILRLSRTYRTPAFEPHVTLLGSITAGAGEVVAAAKTLASDIRPMPIELVRVDGEDDFFRCVYLEARPSRAILDANRQARKLCRQADRPFLPHLSLVYGTLGPAVKRRVRTRLERLIPIELDTDALEVWRTVGAVGDWTRVARFNLVST